MSNAFADKDKGLQPKLKNRGLDVASVAKENLICVFSADVDVSFAAEAV